VRSLTDSHAACSRGSVLLHLHHVLLQVLGNLGVFLTVVEQGRFKLFVFVSLTSLEEDLVLRFALINHHLDHKLHLVSLVGGCLVTEVCCSILHRLSLNLGSLLQTREGLLFGKLWGLVLFGSHEFALLGSHHELSELRILRKLHVASSESIFFNVSEATSNFEDVLSESVLQLEHL